MPFPDFVIYKSNSEAAISQLRLALLFIRNFVVHREEYQIFASSSGQKVCPNEIVIYFLLY